MLIKPGLQLRLSATFVGLVALVLGLQFVLLTSIFHQTAATLPNDGALLRTTASRSALYLVGVSALVFLPLTMLAGIVTSFRVAGPMRRIEAFLVAVREGETPPSLGLRSRDELKGLAELINDATRPLRTESVVRDLDGVSHSPESTARESVSSSLAA